MREAQTVTRGTSYSPSSASHRAVPTPCPEMPSPHTKDPDTHPGRYCQSPPKRPPSPPPACIGRGGSAPGRAVIVPRRPGVQLLGRIIGGADDVDSLVKQRPQGAVLCRADFSQRQAGAYMPLHGTHLPKCRNRAGKGPARSLFHLRFFRLGKEPRNAFAVFAGVLEAGDEGLQRFGIPAVDAEQVLLESNCSRARRAGSSSRYASARLFQSSPLPVKPSSARAANTSWRYVPVLRPTDAPAACSTQKKGAMRSLISSSASSSSSSSGAVLARCSSSRRAASLRRSFHRSGFSAAGRKCSAAADC